MSDADESQPDGPMTPEEEATARSLTAADLQRIDECLLSHMSDRWQKVARIVALTMQKLDRQVPGLPDVFYSGCINHLADCGAIEAAGDPNRMRFSEVRLPAQKFR